RDSRQRSAARRKPRREAQAAAPGVPFASRSFLRRLMQATLLSAFAALMMVTLGIWLQTGGIAAVHKAADGVTSLGRLTGLIAAVSLLLQLLLMARLPFVEFAFGWSRTSAWHKLNGKICLGLVGAHVVLVITGYAMTAHISVFQEAVQMFQRLYGMPAAVVATAAMLVIVGTSIAIVRCRLRYELWYLVHLLAYATVLLAWFHQVPTSTVFVNNPMATAFWTALFVGTLQLVVLFRLVQPLVRTLWHGLRVADVRDEGEGVVSVRMTGRHLEWYNARAGQFFIWRFLAPGFWTEAHPFSLSQAPDGRSFRISAKGVGDFSSRLSRLKPGTRVIAEGPFGSFTDEARTRDRVVMIAGGIGITPIRALLEELEGKVSVIYRVIRDEEAHLREELDELAARRGAVIHYVVGDHRNPKNKHLMTPNHLKSLVPDLASRDVYLCGPPPMMRLAEASVKKLGVSPKNIHKDAFLI
ncbi:MAG TPA: ferredoxin reductase family protein, partial [Actinomycetota bacterium]|nr:ferredoxin reductase family protein [Actinomycetota bacterium]